MVKEKDLRIVKTEQALCDAFLHLMEQKTFDEISVKEICDTALIRRATFYTHFADKYDFLSFYIQHVQSAFAMNSPTTANIDTASYIYLQTAQLLTYITDHKKVMDSFLRSNMIHMILQLLVDHMKQDMILRMKQDATEGILYTIPAATLAAAISGAIIQVLCDWITQGYPVSREELLAEIQMLGDAFTFPT